MLAVVHTLIAEKLHDRAFVDRYCTGFDRLADYVTGIADGQPKDAAWAASLSEILADEIRKLARNHGGGALPDRRDVLVAERGTQ